MQVSSSTLWISLYATVFFVFFFLQFKPKFNQDIDLALNVVLPSTINTLWIPCEYRRMVLKRFLGI